MNVCTELVIPIYNVGIRITLCDNIWSYYKEVGYEGIKEEVDTFQAVVVACSGKPGSYYSYDLILLDDDNYTPGVIAHEAYHIVNYVMRFCGVIYSEESEEAFAYLLTALVNEITEQLMILKLRKEEHGNSNPSEEVRTADFGITEMEGHYSHL
jgi:hypothetical protein